jgi:hypothetical protein
MTVCVGIEYDRGRHVENAEFVEGEDAVSFRVCSLPVGGLVALCDYRN